MLFLACDGKASARQSPAASIMAGEALPVINNKGCFMMDLGSGFMMILI